MLRDDDFLFKDRLRFKLDFDSRHLACVNGCALRPIRKTNTVKTNFDRAFGQIDRGLTAVIR